MYESFKFFKFTTQSISDMAVKFNARGKKRWVGRFHKTCTLVSPAKCYRIAINKVLMENAKIVGQKGYPFKMPVANLA